MRLSAHESDTIKAAARKAFGDTVVVRLFGSRVHDDLKGGDIDLLIETSSVEPGLHARSLFLDLIDEATDGKKTDLLFIRAGEALRGFARLAFETAVAL